MRTKGRLRHFSFWMKDEVLRVFPVFIFFLIAFTLINVTEKVLMRRAGMTPFTFINILVAAGLVAKILLVIDHLRIANIFSRKPLLYNVVWKTFFYWFITLCIRFLIRLVPFLFKGEGLAREYKNFFQNMDWTLFFSIQTWYLMLFFLFVTARELVSVIGLAKMRQIFLGKK